MPDFNAPFNASSSGGGLQTLKDLMSLKQSQQALQSGALTIQGQQSSNQSLAAKASSDTRTNAQQDALSKVNWDQFEKPDGSYDIDGARRTAMRVAPNEGPDAVDRIAKMQQSGVAAKEAFMGLNGQMQDQARKIVGGWGADPKAPPEQLVSQAELARSNAPDAVKDQVGKVVDHTLDTITGPNPITGKPRTLAEQKQAALAMSRTGLSPDQVSGPGGLTTPGTALADTGPTLQPLAVNRMTGETTNAGAPIRKDLAPTDQPVYRAQVASATQRASGTASSDVDRSREVADLQQQSSAAIPLTKRIDELSHEINSGHLAKMLSEGGNYLGFSSLNEARSQLNKDLGQVKGLAVSKAGSDSRASTILEGYPTDTTPEDTTHAAMDYIRGTARQNLARGKLLGQYQQSDPDGLKGFQHADNILSGQTNPLMHEYLALKPEEQKGFYRRNFSTPQEAQDFKNQVNALKKHTDVLGQ